METTTAVETAGQMAEGIAHAETVPELPADQFIALADRIGRTSRDAR